MQVYVYYRVKTNDPATDALVRAIQARLTCHTGLRGQLLKRCDDPLTWMEIYHGVTDLNLLQTQLQRLSDEFDLTSFLDGPRHLECFV
jgi:hypothetical protein